MLLGNAATFLSFQNLAAVYGTLTATSAATGYPASNLALASHYLPWRSTSTAEQRIVIDLGVARPVDRLALLNANFGLFRVEQNDTDVWTAPVYTSGPQAVARDFTRRVYRRWFQPAPSTRLTRRFTSLVIPAQTPLDGAAYFSLGTLWMGLFHQLPTDPKVLFSPGVVAPRVREQAALGQWVVQYKSGDPFAVHRYTRQAAMGRNPGTDDEWGAWLDLDRQIDDAGAFCYLVEGWGDAEGGVWIMQQTSPHDWQCNWPEATDAWDLTEVVT